MKMRFLLLLLLAFRCFAQVTNVNLGTVANDKSGDPIRTAFSKINTNVTWLASQLAFSTNASTTLSNAVAASKISATNGFGVGTTISNATVYSGQSIPQGIYYGTDDNDLGNGFNPARHSLAIATDPDYAGLWRWNSTSIDDGYGFISVQGYATGRLERFIGINGPLSLLKGKGATIDLDGRIISSTATKQQVDNTQAQFATVAALVANTGTTEDWPNGVVVTVGGYWSNGDGGGGLFRALSSASSGLIVTNAGGQKFQAVFEGVTLPLKRWGLKGDGSTDDTAKWDVLNTYLNTTAGAGSVVVAPPGIFTISHACAFSNSVSIIGAGSSNTFFRMTAVHGATAPATGFDTSGGTNSVNWYFVGSKGVNLRGFTKQNATYPSWSNYTNYYQATFSARAYGFRFRLCDDVYMKDVRLENSYHVGVKFEGVYNATAEDCAVSVSLKDAFLTDVSSTGTLKESRNIRYVRCLVSGGGDVGFGLNSEPGAGVTNCPQVHDIVVDSCRVTGSIDWSGTGYAVTNSTPGFNVTGPRDVKVVNSYFSGSRRAPHFLLAASASSAPHTMSNIVVALNTFQFNQGDNDTAAAVKDTVAFQVVGNQFINSVGLIYVGNSSDGVISRNTYENCAPQSVASGKIVSGALYRVSGGVINYNGSSIDGTAGTMASREFTGASVTTFTNTSGSPIIYDRSAAVLQTVSGAANIRFEGNHIDTWPLGIVYYAGGSGLMTINGNVCNNTQTLGDSTYGIIHALNGSYTLQGKNSWLNIGANSPGEITQAGSTPLMKLGNESVTYNVHSVKRRVLTSAQVITANTTLADITGLTTTLKPYKTYMVRAHLEFTVANTTMGYKFGWTTPGSLGVNQRTTVLYNSVAKSIGDMGVPGNWTTAISGSLGNAARHAVDVEGLITTGASGGNLVPQAAQNTSDAGNFTIHSGAWVEIAEAVIE